MNTTKHPLVGKFVTGYLCGQNEVALVEKVKMTGRGKSKKLDGLVVRLANTHKVNEVPKGLSSWDRAKFIYCGRRRHVELRLVKRVWPGPEEAWVEFQDFIDWCEGPEP